MNIHLLPSFVIKVLCLGVLSFLLHACAAEKKVEKKVEKMEHQLEKKGSKVFEFGPDPGDG